MFDKRKPLQEGWELVFGEEHRYIITEEIGRGGSCLVYNGFYRDRLGEKHLVKIKECYPYRLEIERDASENLSPSLSCKQEFLLEKQKFQEAYLKNTALKATLGLMNSTANATNIYEYHNTWYVVMTEIEGRDYRSAADENLQSVFLRLQTLVRIVKKYHDCGMLHLDIKPENILLVPETKEQMILFDFGSLAKKEEIQKQQSKKPFSVSDGYAAPELVRGKCSKICEATDVYSIGAIAFSKIFGRTPNALDSAVGTAYDFSDMKWKDVRYQPALFRLMQQFFRRTLAATVRRRYQSMDEVLEILEQLIRESNIERMFLYHNFTYNTANFVGREEELKQMESLFSSGQQVLFLSGMGGIGKTELAKRYAYLYGETYRTIVFVPYRGSIVQTVCGEDIHIHKVQREQTEEGMEPEEDYFERKLTILKEQTTKDDLIILDNFDVEEDEDLERLLECSCHFLITTREDFRDYDFCQLDLRQIQDQKEVEALFCAYNAENYEEGDRAQIWEILKLVECHTMTVELIAKYLRLTGEKPSALLEHMRKVEGITGTEEISVKQRKDKKMQVKSVQRHLLALFDLSGFSAVQMELMRSLSLLGYVRIAKETFLSYVPLAQAEEALEELIRRGWVEQNRKTDKISLHQIILDLIYHHLNPNVENCPAITEKMTVYAQQDLESFALNQVKSQFLEYFMERISGEDLAYAKLCVAYCGHVHNEMRYLRRAERICLSMQEEECHRLLYKIYLLQIKKLNEKEEVWEKMVFDYDRDFDEEVYAEQIFGQVCDLAKKADTEIRAYTADAGLLGKSSVDMALAVNDTAEDAFLFLSMESEETMQALQDLLELAVHFMDQAEGYLEHASMDDKEKVLLYGKMAEFFMIDELEIDYRKEYYGDQERAHFYKEKIAGLGEEISCVQALEKIAENWIRLKDMEEAAACWKQILQVEMENRKADDGAWYHADLCCRLTSYLKEQGQMDEARHYAMELVQCCRPKEEEWNVYEYSYYLAGMYQVYQMETDAEKIRQAFFYVQNRTEWEDAESNVVFLNYILELVRGKEKFAPEEIRALLYRSRSYLDLAGDHVKEAMQDAFTALKKQKQIKNQDAYLRSLGYKMLARCYQEKYSSMDERIEMLQRKCDYFLLAEMDCKDKKTAKQLDIWEKAALDCCDIENDPMEERCYQQMEVLFQTLQENEARIYYRRQEFAKNRARCAGRQKQPEKVRKIIREAYNWWMRRFLKLEQEDDLDYDERDMRLFVWDLEKQAEILADAGLSQEAFVLYIMAMIVHSDNNQAAQFFNSVDSYFAGEWNLLYEVFEKVIHQKVTKPQVDHLMDVLEYLQRDEMNDFWNGSKAEAFRKQIDWFVDTYCHDEIEFKREV